MANAVVFCVVDVCVCWDEEVPVGLDGLKDPWDSSGEGTDGDVMVELSETLSTPMLSWYRQFLLNFARAFWNQTCRKQTSWGLDTIRLLIYISVREEVRDFRCVWLRLWLDWTDQRDLPPIVGGGVENGALNWTLSASRCDTHAAFAFFFTDEVN